jgi:hypothetical protein
MGDPQAIQANQIIRQSAPLGAMAGDAAVMALPMGLAGNTIGGAAKVGTILGGLQPVNGPQTAENITRGTLLNMATNGAGAALGQGVANGAGALLKKAEDGIALLRAQYAPKTQTLNSALDAGFVAPPSSVNPTLFNTLRESIAGKIATAQQASNMNADLADTLARRAAGLPSDTPLTSEAMRAVRTQAYQDGYAPVAQIGTVTTDGNYGRALDALASRYQGAAQDFPGAFKNDVVDQLNSLRVPQFDAANGLKASQLLRDQARVSFRAGDTGLGQAQTGASRAIEDQIERSLSGAGQSGSDMLQAFRDARQRMAIAHDIEDAVVEGGGSIDARVLARKYQNGDPLSGDLKTIGAFANNFPKAMQPAKQVAGPGISKLDLAMAVASAGGGAALDGKEGGIVGAVLPVLASRAARAQALSKMSQNALRDIYQLGLAPRVANGLLQYAPIGGAVLGSHALSQ